MQNVQKCRDVNYHYHCQYSAPIQHINQNTFSNIYATNQPYGNQFRSSVQLSPTLSVPTSVSPISSCCQGFTDIYYNNNLTLPVSCQSISLNGPGLSLPTTNNNETDVSNSNQQFSASMQLNQQSYINIQNSYKINNYNQVDNNNNYIDQNASYNIPASNNNVSRFTCVSQQKMIK